MMSCATQRPIVVRLVSLRNRMEFLVPPHGVPPDSGSASGSSRRADSKAAMSERLRPPGGLRCGGSSARATGFDRSAGNEGTAHSRPPSIHKNLFGKGFGHTHPFLP